MFKFLSKKNKGTLAGGFTLVEAMVAISILSLAITGPMIISQKGIGAAIYARDQITAFYLAQEAVEYVRVIRDTNRINNAEWLTSLEPCIDDGGGQACTIDARFVSNFSAAISSCSGACPIMWYYIDTGGAGVYGYPPGGVGASGWTKTSFTRTVSIDQRAAPSKQAMVTVTISWNTNLFAPVKKFTIKEYLTNF